MPKMPPKKPIELVPPKAKRFCTSRGTSSRIGPRLASLLTWPATGRPLRRPLLSATCDPTQVVQNLLKVLVGEGLPLGKLSVLERPHPLPETRQERPRLLLRTGAAGCSTSAMRRRTRRFIGPLNRPLSSGPCSQAYCRGDTLGPRPRRPRRGSAGHPRREPRSAFFEVLQAFREPVSS